MAIKMFSSQSFSLSLSLLFTFTLIKNFIGFNFFLEVHTSTIRSQCIKLTFILLQITSYELLISLAFESFFSEPLPYYMNFVYHFVSFIEIYYIPGMNFLMFCSEIVFVS